MLRFEIMSWKQDDNLKDYKSNNKALLKSSDIVKYKHKINKAANTWKTESQDAFRKFIYSPTKKTAVYQGNKYQYIYIISIKYVIN